MQPPLERPADTDWNGATDMTNRTGSNLKTCKRCRTPKARSCFNKDRTREDGLQNWCRQCTITQHRDYAVRLAAGEDCSVPIRACLAGYEGSLSIADARRARTVYYRYKLLWRDFLTLLAEQGGKCAICCTSFGDSRVAVDHDHECCPGTRSCGRCVRGLLCLNCNKAIGFFMESVANLGRAHDYLKRASR